MAEQGQGTDRAGGRRKRSLTPKEQYEIWLKLLRKEATIAEAAVQAGVDPATVVKLRTVAKQGALDALATHGRGCGAGASTLSWPRPGRRSSGSPRRSPRWACA